MIGLSDTQIHSLIPRWWYRHGLFIENWSQPDGFDTLWKAARRRSLYHNLRETLYTKKALDCGICIPKPTRFCSWVWFGSYTVVKIAGQYMTSSPRYNNQSVRRILWETLAQTKLLPESRLTPVWGCQRSDMNPYKHLPGFARYLDKRDMMINHMGLDPSQRIAKPHKQVLERELHHGVSRETLQHISECIMQMCPDSNSLKTIGFQRISDTLKQLFSINDTHAIKTVFDELLSTGYEVPIEEYFE